MVGSQFHPEFKSRPTRPHPLFLGLIKAAQRFHEQHQHTAQNGNLATSLAKKGVGGLPASASTQSA
jgi:CTP synthase